MNVTLHLITQDDQPYGSRRKCCEVCGAMLHKNLTYTDDRDAYKNLPKGGPNYIRCVSN